MLVALWVIAPFAIGDRTAERADIRVSTG